MTRSAFFRTLIVLLAVAAFCLSAAEWVLAAEGYDSKEELKDLFYRFLNFGVLVVILVVAAKKVGIKRVFAARSEGIRERLETLQKQKEAAEKRCSEVEAALEAFQSEKAAILQRFRAEGEAEKERIIAEAREKARQILLQAEMAVKREVRSAENLLRAELVDFVAAKAGELIAGAMTDKDQDFLVEEFIKKVEKLH